MHDIKNNEIARILLEVGEYLEMRGVPFKPRAYERASEAISSLEQSLVSIYKEGGIKALSEVSGVGVSIAGTIEELIKTGKSTVHEELKQKIPINLSELTKVESLGPKNIRKLYEALDIKNLVDLEKAAKEKKIRKLSGFGIKSEEKILKGIDFLKRLGGRFVLGFLMPQILDIKEKLSKLKEVEKIEIAGSVRRRRDTVGDLDILIVSKNPKPVMDFFIKLPQVFDVLAHGETKSAVRMKNGLEVDLRVVGEKSYGSALNYFTGSKDHNIALRQLAMEKGLRLSEYGVFRGEKQIAGKNEEEIYETLGLHYIEPELRENGGEIKCSMEGSLPKIIGYSDLRGDLQVQSDWTDGGNTIEVMALEAIKYGLEYIAITDHTKRLAMTHGLDEKRLFKQMEEIDRINKKLGGKIKILKGSECDILKDGTMDLNDKALSKLDVVGASIHSYFNLSREDQTKRLIRAMENKNVDIIYHPTGRVINRRDAYDIDVGKVMRVAKETGTVLEINAYPDRSDLKDEYIRQAVDLGVKLSVDSDAHSVYHFRYLEFGLSGARRGWATKNDVINTRSWEEMLGLLK